MKPLVELNEVYTSYNGKNVLEGVSLKIFEGDKIGLIGNNGAGKTTIIYVLCNLHPYNKGIYLFNGGKVDPSSVEYKEKIGIVLSEHFFIEEFTVREYLLFVAQMYGVDRELFNERFKEWIYRFKIDHLVNERINNLSSGEKMKVSILASILHDPIFLIYDEPFTYLDFNSVELLKNSIIKSKNKTVLIASNNINECLDVCNKFLIVEDGKIGYSFKKDRDDEEGMVKERIKKVMVDKEMVEWL